MNESDDRAGERWLDKYKRAYQNTRNSLAKVDVAILYTELLTKKRQLTEAATHEPTLFIKPIADRAQTTISDAVVHIRTYKLRKSLVLKLQQTGTILTLLPTE